MRITLSVIKADIGSSGGHICPSESVLATWFTVRGAKSAPRKASGGAGD